jgi:tryptophanase
MNEPYKTLFEPFRIKVIEPIRLSTQTQRKKYLEEAGLNLFLIKAEHVLIDLLTDSGTTAQSAEQWAAIQRGDESYAGSPSYYRFENSVKEITGFTEIIPTHQGRAAERILFNTLCESGDIVVSNMLFDTTRANAEAAGCTTIDIPCPELMETTTASDFKGNIDLEKLEAAFKENKNQIALVVLTITNNSGGGQPVSMKNIRETATLCKKYECTFVLDACRFAENAWFIKTREPNYADKSPQAIALEAFNHADLCTISAKKDGMTNTGGFIACRNPEWAERFRNNLILTEGFPTYGGLSGRDLDALAVGIHESLDEDYLRYRIKSTAYVGEALLKADIPIMNPPGGHAIYIDAKAFLPHIPVAQYPGQALVAGLYEAAGIRGVEIGSAMFGRENPDGTDTPHVQELVRLAIPRRVYTQSHMDYVIEALIKFKETAASLRGVHFTHKPKVLRHFTARFAWN